jgi:capsular polysaccharide biosynthesis protein
MENFPKSTRKYIRTEKARIHREIFDIQEQRKLIDELYKKVIKSPKIKEPVSETKNKSIKVSKNETDLSDGARPVKQSLLNSAESNLTRFPRSRI